MPAAIIKRNGLIFHLPASKIVPMRIPADTTFKSPRIPLNIKYPADATRPTVTGLTPERTP